MKRLANGKSINIIIFVFLIIQPFLEIHWLYHFDGIERTFILSPSTLIRLLTFLLLFIVFIVDKKKYKEFIMISAVFIFYSIMHHSFASNTNFFLSDTYSFIREMFYLIRLAIPIYLIYFLIFYKLENKTIEKGSYICAYIFGVIMLVTNILMIALPAYPFGTVEGNIFHWFIGGEGLHFEELTTRGIFNQANQLSGFLTLLLPILLYYLYKSFSIVKVGGVILIILSMFMLGTRVSSWSVLIIGVVMLGIYIFMALIKKIEIDKKILIGNAVIICFSIFVFMFSPIQARDSLFPTEPTFESDEERERILTQIDIYLTMNESEINDVHKEIGIFVRDINYNFHVPTIFIEMFPPEEVPRFWLEFFINTEPERLADFRVIHSAMVTAIHEEYGDLRTRLFGFSYSATFENGMYLERDIIVHIFYVGIIGTLLFIGPFIAIILYGIYKVLRYQKEMLTHENLTYILAMSLTILVSLFSGNMLDIFIVTMPLAIVSSLLLKNIRMVNKDAKS